MSTMKTRRSHWVPVVTALIRKGDEVLVGLRPDGHTLAGQWEFPGGKIEKGESPEQALCRELREELDIEAEIDQLRLASTHTYGDTGIILLFYDVHFWKGEPKTKHHQALKWIKIIDLDKLDIPEANRKILDRLKTILKG
jgi:8-oxo-dGTP diphosphatase